MLMPFVRTCAAIIRRRIRQFGADRQAVTAIEYALIAVIMVTAMIGGLSIIGGHLATSFNQVSSEL